MGRERSTPMTSGCKRKDIKGKYSCSTSGVQDELVRLGFQKGKEQFAFILLYEEANGSGEPLVVLFRPFIKQLGSLHRERLAFHTYPVKYSGNLPRSASRLSRKRFLSLRATVGSVAIRRPLRGRAMSDSEFTRFGTRHRHLQHTGGRRSSQ